MTRGNPLALALGGMLALAAAMGIGRFLYTPALPMMAEATGLGPRQAGLLAGANFAGYLAGALAASLPGWPRSARRAMLLALLGSAATTGAMALTENMAAWAALRFLGGGASAVVLVVSSALVVQRLRRAGAGRLVALHFAGVGVGIVLTSALASPLVLEGDAWRALWLAGGAVGALAVLAAAALIPAEAPGGPAPVAATAAGRRGLWRLVLAYGCLGFGYVITATFIVAMLREGAAGRTAESAVWALVGLAAAPSVLLWTRWAGRIGPIRAWQAAMAVQAAGVALSAWSSAAWALGLAALALGGTFMGLTALGLQEAARRAGGDGRAVMGLMTASFGTGQIVGPVLAGWLRAETGGYAAPSLAAAVVLIAGALLVAPLGRSRGG